MQKRHRVFIAINLPEEIKKELSFYAEKWADLPAKWVGKDNMHITIEFLGDLTDEEVADVCKITKEAAKRHSGFSLNLISVNYGPNRKISLPAGRQAPRLVWVTGEKSDDLNDFKDDLQDYLLESIRYRPEGRGFVPHITLARIKEWEWKRIDPDERPEINEEIDLAFSVGSIEVMESELKRGGPQYTILESCELNI